MPNDFHEGDMAQELAEYWINSMPLQELRDKYGPDPTEGSMSAWLSVAYMNLLDDIKSWPPTKIRAHYFSLFGGPDGLTLVPKGDY